MRITTVGQRRLLDLSTDEDDYNGGHGQGPEGFKKLLNQAWKSAIADAKKMCKECKCKSIKVVFECDKNVKNESRVLKHGGWCQKQATIHCDN